MCGIAGIFNTKTPIDTKRLQKAASLLEHRGPDHTDCFVSGNIGLAHTRLSIIDLAGGDQPFRHPDNLTLVANGEVYNYLELRQQHQASGIEYQTGSDCESILHGYMKHGIDCLPQLNGMFAFALYDGNQNKLTIARDRLGIKPLFYAQTNKGWVFASEIKSLLALIDSTPNISDFALLQFLQHQFYSGTNTIFDGIYQVLPGEVIEINHQGEIKKNAYWTPKQVENKDYTLSQANEAFSPLFNTVINEHMRSDVPFGLFLSGGIDSSILLAELTERKQQPIRTFSLGYAEANIKDELSQAEALAKQFNTEHTSLSVNPDDLLSRVVHTIWATDDLMRDYACLPTSLLSEIAGNELKVVFSGEGGDESFAGYRRYKPSFEQKLKSMLLGGGGLRSSGQLKRSTPSKLFNANLRGHDHRRGIKQAWSGSPNHWSQMQRAQYVDLTTALPDNLLVKADRMMMAFGLEGRVPFCDHRIVEFGLSLPDELKYKDNKGKWFLRQWAERKLPQNHLNLPKRGFYVPVNSWLQGKYLTQIGGKLQQNEAIKNWFNTRYISELVSAQNQGKNYSRELFCLIQFAIWHRLFAESSPKPNVQEELLDWL